MIEGNGLYTQFDNIFFEKTRLSIMTILYKEKEVSFNRMKKLLGASDGAIYTHLQKLQEAKYITQKREIAGKSAQTVYSLNKEGKKIFRKYLSFLEVYISGIGQK